MRHFLLFLCALSFVRAAHPEAFSSLGGALEEKRSTLRALEGMPWIERREVDRFAEAQQACFEKGYALDAALRTRSPKQNALRSSYLGCLRTLQRESGRWEHRYASALQKAIDDDAAEDFERLVTHPLEPLNRPSLQEQALAYYETIRGTHPVDAMETLRETVANTQYAVYEESVAPEHPVMGVAEAYRSSASVVMFAKEQYRGLVFYAKNRNAFPVTLTLNASKMQNFKTPVSLPLSIELDPKTEKKILDIAIIDRRKEATLHPRYSWVMGRASARHSDPLYRLPFAVGSDVRVSQGFNGDLTHTGRSRYAVDFGCPVGTKVYAARGGRVIAVETRHNRGGFDPRFRADANYIIIEHADHTLGKYIHLKQHGSEVRVGEKVRRGQLIGHSGMTGYCSAPHLHFSVGSVDPESKRAGITLPFRFQTAEGTVDRPKSGDVYRVVRVQ